MTREEAQIAFNGESWERTALSSEVDLIDEIYDDFDKEKLMLLKQAGDYQDRLLIALDDNIALVKAAIVIKENE